MNEVVHKQRLDAPGTLPSECSCVSMKSQRARTADPGTVENQGQIIQERKVVSANLVTTESALCLPFQTSISAIQYLEREVLLFEVRSDNQLLSALLVREGQLVSPNPRQGTDAVLSSQQNNEIKSSNP